MRLPGLKAVRQSARWLRSRCFPGALILGYHRVGSAGPDPFAVNVSLPNFAEQLEVLRRWAQPMHLQQVLEGLRNGRLPARAVAVTFDDGYAGTLEKVRPLLERFEIPATVFVTTGYLGHEFWWDELARLLSGCRAALPGGLAAIIDRPTAGPPAQQLHQAYRHLLGLSAMEREAALVRLRAGADREAGGQAADRGLTPDELVQLAGNDLVSIGAHSVTHPMLAAQPVGQQRWEVQESKTCLEGLLARPVSAFSYPNGSMSADTQAIVAEAGFACACGSAGDVARPGTDRFALPRFWVPDWRGGSLRRWLNWWLCR